MADRVYQQGESVPLQATFTNAAGTPTDTTVTLTVRRPDGTTTTPTPTHTGTGVYTYNQPTTTAATDVGLWWYTFQGTGGVDAVEQGSFMVEQVQTAASTLSHGRLSRSTRRANTCSARSLTTRTTGS
jgi:uncharacterized protein YfaS (alpha-2-macroglobulin family)